MIWTGRERPAVCRRAAVGAFWICLFWISLTGTALAVDRAGARDAYQRAQDRETELRAKPAAQRTESEYQAVFSLYDRVPRLDPAFEGVDNSLYNLSLVSREAYRTFRKSRWIQRALRGTDWLVREYPHSPLRDDALMLRGDIQAEDLGDSAAARATYETFLKRFARSKLAPEVRRKLAALTNAPTKPAATAQSSTARPADATPVAARTATAASPTPAVRTMSETNLPPPGGSTGSGIASQLLEVRYWSTADYTRIVIELDRKVTMQHNEVENPYRIYIDFQRTVLAPALKGKNFAVGDLFLDRIRVGQYQENVARVVLDFKKKGSFTIFTLDNPFRVVIDIRDAQKTITLEERKKKLARVFQDSQQRSSESKPATSTPPDKKAETPAPKSGTPEKKPPAEGKKAETPAKSAEPSTRPAATPAKTAESTPPKTDQAHKEPPPAERKPSITPTPVPKPAAPAADKKADTVPAPSPEAPPTPSQPTSDGKRTLARILGMKVAKIVIDPGHGGKDCGSIGWNGIMEKDVTLAIAKRIKAEIEQRLAIEVILTRDRDVFVPLEQRTAIANVEQADLFISLHSNASKNDRIAGLESFYLGLTREPRAQMLAALENASAQQNLSELEDVIKKITMYEKMNESKDFAVKVHRKLYQTVKKIEPAARDRGVKKAPFVVLIGADVPSILLEIGFISNKREAQIISNAATQDKVAAGISRGIEDYLASLGTLARNPVPDGESSADGKTQ